MNFFASVKLAAVLVALITLASAIGTFIPQSDIYHSSWFILLLSLFGLNLFTCTLNRLKFWRTKTGLLVTHISLLLILAGTIISAKLGESGFMPLSKGAAGESFKSGNKEIKLGFKVYLEDFTLERYDSSGHRLDILFKGRTVKKSLQVEIGKEYNLPGSDYTFEVLAYLPDFYLEGLKNAQTRSNAPNNPALSVRIKQKGEVIRQRWLFANFPDFYHGTEEDLKLAYIFNSRVKSFKSRVQIIDEDKTLLAKTIEVNHPLKFSGYTFYQSGYDPKNPQWTELKVVKDPGVGFVYAGFILLNIGVILVFYPTIYRSIPPRRWRTWGGI